MRIYNLLRRKDKDRHYNFNLLPFVSLFWGDEYCYINIGWLNLCFQFQIT